MTTETQSLERVVTEADFDLDVDFDFEISEAKARSPADSTSSPQINTRIFYKGSLIHEGVLPGEMQASAVVQAALELSDLPRSSNYGLYLRKSGNEDAYVFCPPGASIEAVCKDNGIAIGDLASVEMEVAPELVGA
jgi:hypothetical protein